MKLTQFAPFRLIALGCALASLLAATLAQAASKQERERETLTTDVTDAIALFKKTDEGIGQLFDTSAGYVVFPKIAKGAAGIGAARGKGQLFEKGNLVGEASLTQVTIGLQLGGQVYSEVIFFETAESLKSFKEGNFEFSAQVSAVAAAEGASRNAKYQHGVLVFTLARTGLMYEASVGGQKFSYRPYEQ
jgi:lipid-binding SYLF domain-containing protein